jgi:acetyl/propionyl-CoA carboxylase alpha subunit/acetyl-CoA carboxylase carboxyltransferase component
VNAGDLGDLRRIAIVNRGEPAMRLIHAVGELRIATGVELRAIALHTAAERAAMFVREADEAVCLDSGRPDGPRSPYLDLPTLEAALVASKADAAWVGWGFVAERPEFAELCARLGIVFVGPRPEVMRSLGDKIGAKRLAEQARVPVAPWSGGPVDTIADAAGHAERIGYPLMVKAAAGGGGRGIRRVDEPGQLSAAFESARAEGASAFGDATVFLEAVITGARHVEVQLIADHHGAVWAAGVRDCSLQRRNQKVIEESHCIALTPQQDAELRAAAVRLATLAGYTNAGTVEFLYQPAGERFAFLEVNTRLQVEHPVTELTTGLDLVKLQLHVAAGGRLEGAVPAATGYAVEARLNAEDPQRGFAPAPGVIETLVLPVGPGIRVDTGVAEGDVIPSEYDSMIAKIIAFGADRGEAIARLGRALSQLIVIIRGGTTNKSFLLDLLERPEVRHGDADTGWLDRLTAAGLHQPTRHADVALVAAALDAADELHAIDRDRFLSWASRGRPHLDGGSGQQVELRHGATACRVNVRRVSRRCFVISVGGQSVVVERNPLGRARSRLTIAGRPFSVVSAIDGVTHLVEVDGVTHRFSRDDAGIVRAPASALVVAVDVHPGDVVATGDRVAVVEAMKMEIAINAPVSGVVSEVLVARNVQVDGGSPLLRIEPRGDDAPDAAAASPISLDELTADGGQPPSADDSEETVRAFLLGYDVEPRAARQAAAAMSDTASIAGVLEVFADVSALAPERRPSDDEDEQRAPREYFNQYLRSLDPEREGIPTWFVERLERAVAHFGLEDLAPRPALHDALMRLFVAQHRMDDQLAVVTTILERRATNRDRDDDAGLRDALDRVIEATQRRHPAMASSARGVRHRLFDRPLIDRSLADVAGVMREHAMAIAGPDAPPVSTGSSHEDALIACTLPLTPVLKAGGLFAATAHPGPLLSVLTRRYYKIRDLDPLTELDVDGFEVVASRYRRHQRAVVVIAARATTGQVDAALAAVSSAADVDSPDTAVVDLYVMIPADDHPTPDELAALLAARVDAAGLQPAIRRVTAIAVHPDPATATQVFTFRRTDEAGEAPFWMRATTAPTEPQGFAEDRKFRGLHPMVARRLQMWRLSNFDISRLPSVDDVYAYDCVARDNPADRRLVAVAEVRGLTPVRDDSGRAVAIPEVELALTGCLDAIRSARATDAQLGRLDWNRVMLYIWPVLELPFDEINAIARRLTPLTEGLGLEQVVVSGRLLLPASIEPVDAVMRLGYEPGHGLTVRITEPPAAPMQPLDDYTRKRIQTRRRGLVHPYELAPMLAGRGGSFVEHDLDEAGRLAAIERAPGLNRAGVVVGVVTTPSDGHPDGITRVAVLGDPTKAMGSIAEAECLRIIAALDLAAAMDVPLEWFALSAGARIAMDSGSENLDWVARVLRRLVEHTQQRGRVGGRGGGEVNIVVAGINVGAQPYWNAEATMLMHTSGILVMTPESAMVLTGKQAIDYSGGVSAEDNLGIGGYARIMGPNGEAQYFAPTIAGAVDVLLEHYRLTYRAPGERWPRRLPTADPADRDVRSHPHVIEGSEFTTVGEIFSDTTNRDRKKPFDIRTVIAAVVDSDHEVLERWQEMADAETAVVCEARLGGCAVTVLGVESRPLPRHGMTPADGPAQWSAGTLFPLSSKKVARAINAANGKRPVVMLANLSGFDGSPESLRRLQLEYGAEIGRALVNFDGPFVLCVVSRYHGGAFVVFSATLNDDMEVLAVEGSFASVIGGAPAAAVVFTREVDERTRADERVQALERAVALAAGHEADQRRAELATAIDAVRTEKLGEVAAEFDAIHSVERAKAVGSVHRIIAAADLRPELIAAVERGMARVDARNSRS